MNRTLRRRDWLAVSGLAVLAAGSAAAWWRRDAIVFRSTYHLDGYSAHFEALRQSLQEGLVHAGQGIAHRPAPAAARDLAAAIGSPGCLTLAGAKWSLDRPLRGLDGVRAFEARLSNGFPFVGLAALAPGGHRGTVVYVHGIATTPHLAFVRDWRGVGQNSPAQLQAAGFDVIVPFVPNAGNLRSLSQLWLMAAAGDVSLHLCLVSMVSACIDAARALAPGRDGNLALYGASIGAMLASHAMALDDRFVATVLTGYASDPRSSLRSHEVQSLALTGDIYPAAFSPAMLEFDLARTVAMTSPRAVLVEYGREDGMVGPRFGTEGEMQAVLKANPNARVSVHSGGHDADARRVIGWLGEAMRST